MGTQVKVKVIVLPSLHVELHAILEDVPAAPGSILRAAPQDCLVALTSPGIVGCPTRAIQRKNI